MTHDSGPEPSDLLEANSEIIERAKRVTLLMLDVDGVLTDGKIYYGNYGDELQSFDAQDGMGMELWRQAGFSSVILSGRRSPMTIRRAKEMRVTKVFQGIKDKEKIYSEILKELGKSDEEICFIGDDLIDIPLLSKVGLAVGVPNAIAEVKQRAHYITEHWGGRGAVREVVDLVLKSKEMWQALMRKIQRRKE